MSRPTGESKQSVIGIGGMYAGWLTDAWFEAGTVACLKWSYSFKLSLPPNVLLSKLHHLYYTKQNGKMAVKTLKPLQSLLKIILKFILHFF